MSGGQRQRVAMGRAIVRQPRVFLFDEPLSNLDAALRSQMRAELKKLHGELGTTMLYVTHDQVEAMTLADRIAVLKFGVLHQIGSPRELYDTPANRFVAGFIGSPAMNFLDGTADGGALAGAGWRYDGPRPDGVDELTIGVRPHDLHIDPEGGFRGTVQFIEPMGWEAHVHVALEEGPNILCRAEATELDGIGQGSAIRLRPETGKVHFFATHGEGERLEV